MPGLEPLFSSAEIRQRLDSLADEIVSTMSPDFMVVAILTGSFVFAADLIRSIMKRGANPEVDFVTLSSYRGTTESSGEIRLLKDMDLAPKGRQILLLDDILDSGRTLKFAQNHLKSRGASDIKICVLLDKSAIRPPGTVGHADFVGFTCPNRFVVGYGMDFAHKYRGLEFIATLCE